MTERDSHPVANAFPLLVGHQFHELILDIRDHGLREPITLHPDGSILDGRNRYRACPMAKVEPKFIQWDEQGSEQDFVISKNLARRHMSESQRAMVAAKLADMPQGARSDLGPIGTMSAAQAADALNVGERSVKRAKSVRKYGNEKLVKAVEAGEMSVSAAARKARPLPTAENKKRDQDQQHDVDVDVDAVSEAGAHAYKKQTAYGAGSDAIGGFEGLCRAWNACSEDEQGRFLMHIGWDVVEELRKERDDLKRALDKQKAKTKDARTVLKNGKRYSTIGSESRS